MRQTFIVSYDVSSPRRLRKVFKLMRGYGDHLQLSVFRCELTAREQLELRGKLSTVIDREEDQVLFVDVGPSEGRGRGCINSVGRPYTHPERHAIVV
jgi:CRISPR-associated protein Cas2